jgi:hypothetical protein
LIGTIFDSLKNINKAKGSKLVIVHLPTENEYWNKYNDGFYEFIRQEVEKRGIMYLNLVKEVRRVSSSEIAKLFFQKDINGFDQSKGHLTPMGNTFVTKRISKTIAKIDSFITQ